MKKFRMVWPAFVAVAAAIAFPVQSVAQDEVIHHVYMNRASVRATIQSVERESNHFRDIFERRYDGMFTANWRRSDESRKAVQNLDKALEVCEGRNRSGEKPQYLRDDVKKVVERAKVLDRMFRRPDDVLSTMGDEWKDLRSSIDQLAEIYGLPEVD